MDKEENLNVVIFCRLNGAGGASQYFPSLVI